ncbi:mucin-5AC-like [Micropterus salmoides]|uniref:mucin-5AC-like n=1 Tax=Micropterus salmoides TaxID=27706 RepID=UPI0018EC48B6|nr:mucin-5AC-like [Micropterus salmoides]
MTCGWSGWINLGKPTPGPDGGEDESIQKIISAGHLVCPAPVEVRCRAVLYPGLSLSQLGQDVTCNTDAGLICINKQQGLEQECFDYEIQLKCCGCPTSPPHSTTVPATTSSTSKTPTPSTTTETTTTHPPTPTTTPSTTTEATTTHPPTTTACPGGHDMTCGWSGWINLGKPTPGPDGGEDESIQKIISAGHLVCPAPVEVRCRAVLYPGLSLSQLGQDVTCNTDAGLICINKQQGLEQECFDYEIQLKCCGCPTSPPHSTTVPATTSSTSKTPTPSTTTETTTTHPPTPTITPSTTTEATTTHLPTTTACPGGHDMTCGWSGWINLGKPTPGPDGGEDESIQKIISAGHLFCPAPVEVRCRAVLYPGLSLSQLGQDVTCNTDAGLICINKQQGLEQECFDYEIQLKCCGCPTSPPHSTTVPATTSSTSKTPTPSTTTETTTTRPPTTTACPGGHDMTCGWSGWINLGKPTPGPDGGEDESIQKIISAGHLVCPAPVEVRCRAVLYPGLSLSQLGQDVTCNTDAGLICINKQQGLEQECFDYEIQLKCCGCPTSPPHSTTVPATTSSTSKPPTPSTTTKTTTSHPSTTTTTISTTTETSTTHPSTTTTTPSTTPETTTTHPSTTITTPSTTTETTTTHPSTTTTTPSTTTEITTTQPSTTTTTTTTPSTTPETTMTHPSTITTTPSTTTETTTTHPSTTTTTPSTTTETTTTHPSTTTSTFSTTTETTTTHPPTTTACPGGHDMTCGWSGWINLGKPTPGPDGGEDESIQKIISAGHLVCPAPVEVRCRAVLYPGLSLSQLGQDVTCNTDAGLICINKQQGLEQECFDYEIQLKCCGCPTSPPHSTTVPATTSSTSKTPTPSTTTETTTTHPPTPTITPSTTTEATTTHLPTTTACPGGHDMTCGWSGWINLGKPTPGPDGGEDESIQKIISAGHLVCPAPVEVRCRAVLYPGLSLSQLGQDVTCNTDAGLICINKQQGLEQECFDYEIQLKCCGCPTKTTTSHPSTTTTTISTTTETSTTHPSTTTTTPSTTPETTTTHPSTTITTPSTTTETTTTHPSTTTTTPSTTTEITTTQPSTTTTTTTTPSTTPETTMTHPSTITTTPSTTTETTTTHPSTTTTTPSTTTETTTTHPSTTTSTFSTTTETTTTHPPTTTACPGGHDMTCGWSGWINLGKPTPGPDGGEDESIQKIISAGHLFCPAPVEVRCRAVLYPGLSLSQLGQDVTCNTDAGLICINKQQGLEQECFDYEIQLKCCGCPTSPPHSTTVPATTSSTSKTPTPSTTTETTTTRPPTTTACPGGHDMTCGWSGWINLGKPTPGPDGGEDESIQKIISAGHLVCPAPVEVRCRAVLYPGLSLSQLGQDVTCNTDAGLICINKQQGLEQECFDYEIQLKCCGCPTSPPHSTTVPATTSSTSKPPTPSTTTKTTTSHPSTTTTTISTTTETSTTHPSTTTTTPSTTPETTTTHPSTTITTPSTTTETTTTHPSTTTTTPSTTTEITTTQPSTTTTTTTTPSTTPETTMTHPPTITTTPSTTTETTTTHPSTTTTTPSTTTETTTTHPSTTTSTFSTTTETTTTHPPTTTACPGGHDMTCGWSGWINLGKPTPGPDGGEDESIQKIISAGHLVCPAPVEVRCRAVLYPGLSLSQLGQDVTCNTDAGLICINKQQGLEQECFDYEIQLKCCGCPTSPPHSTTVPATTSSTSKTPTPSTTTETTTTHPPTPTTTPSTTTEATTTHPPTTTACPGGHDMTCGWSGWINLGKPTPGPDGGEDESIQKIISAGHLVCPAPVEVRCRAVLYPGLSLSQLGQDVTCNTDAGLICINKQQGLEQECFDYEIQLKCCGCPTSPPHSTTVPATTSSTSKTPTPSTTTETTTTHPPTPTITPSTTTEATTTHLPTTTACPGGHDMTCGWSGWINLGKPTPGPDGGEDESIQKIISAGHLFAQPQ